MRALFLIGVALAIAIWVSLPNGEAPAPLAAPPTAVAPIDDAAVPVATSDDQPSQRETPPPLDPEELDPWHPAVLARAAKDRFGAPLDPKTFLHWMIPKHWPERVERGSLSCYCINLDELIDALPPAAQEGAKARWSELAELVKDLTDSAYTLAKEHWRVRARDLHRAIEAGDLVLVEFDSKLPEPEKAMRIADAKAALNLGLNTRDYYEIISAARSEKPGRQVSAFIYCTREKYPEGLELLDECGKLRKAALARICERLGISPEHCAQIWFY